MERKAGTSDPLSHGLGRYLFSSATVVAVAINLIPLLGVLFWTWSLAYLLSSYVVEFAIILLWLLPRVGALAEPHEARGAIILTIWFGLSLVGLLYSVVDRIFGRAAMPGFEFVAWMSAAFFVPHGITYVRDFRRPRLRQMAASGGERDPARDTAELKDIISSASVRYAGTFLLVAVTVWVVQGSGSTLAGLLSLVALKTLIDVIGEAFANWDRALRKAGVKRDPTRTLD